MNGLSKLWVPVALLVGIVAGMIIGSRLGSRRYTIHLNPEAWIKLDTRTAATWMLSRYGWMALHSEAAAEAYKPGMSLKDAKKIQVEENQLFATPVVIPDAK